MAAMQGPPDEPHSAAVLTASDGVAHGARDDRSGAAVAGVLADAGFEVTARRVLPDDREELAAALRGWADDGVRLVVVTGGTGVGPRDVTPEAVADVADRSLPGFGEAMRAAGRAVTPLADLSRSVAGTVGETLVVAVPGSPGGAVDSLRAVTALLPHALQLLAGDTSHGADADHENDHAGHGHGAADRDAGHGHDAAHDHGGAAHGHGRNPAHGAPGHEHDEACAVAHGQEEPPAVGTLMAVFASPLSALLLAWGRELGYEVVLVEPRGQGPGPEDLQVVTSPAEADEATDVVVTDHHRDELVDMLDTALDTPARFIGLMGSPRVEPPHVAPLRERGRSEQEVARVVRPIGIDIGSKTPAEIAVSTLADLVARRRGVRS